MSGLALELQALAARHPAARAGTAPALQPLTLSLGAGEVLAVIGPSGAGKTTLLQALACALPPAAGGLTLDGTNPWALPRRQLQALRGRLFLAPQVPPLPPRQRVVTSVLAGRLQQLYAQHEHELQGAWTRGAAEPAGPATAAPAPVVMHCR